MARSSGQNPLVTDDYLQQLLSTVNELDNEASFLSWRKSFVKAYSKYLDPDGVLNAKDSNHRLLKQLTGLANRGLQVKTLIWNGNIRSVDEVTAEGRRALTNLSEELKVTEQSIHEFMPRTSAHEERVGYDKFELGAVLIQDGFHGYDLMVNTRDYLEQTVQTQLEGVVDQNFIKILKYYSNELDSFVEVMEDLGLFNIMKQCVEVIYKGKERPTPKAPKPRCDGDDGDDENKTNGKEFSGPNSLSKTGSQHGGKNGASKRGGSMTNGANSKEITMGGMRSPLGGSSHNGSHHKNDDSCFNEDESLEAPEPVDTVEPLPQKGQGGGGESEYLIYFDPKTNTIGRIGRDECGSKSRLLIDVSKEGSEAYQGVIEDEREKQEIIWLLKKMEKAKPVEISWLDKIKAEKAAEAAKMIKSSGGSGAEADKKQKAANKMKSTGSSTRSVTNRCSVKSEKPGVRTPFVADPSSTKKKATVEDYQGQYKKVAPKPDSGGWRKLS
jgi:hypothetical protein